MSSSDTVLYEGMFLVNQQQMAGDLAGAIETVRGMLDRAEAEVVALYKWDERKLAYPVATQKQGLFIYGLFRVRPVQIANIERDCNLSELILRVLITRGDHMGEVEIEAAVKEAEERSVEAELRDSDESSGDDKDAGAEASEKGSDSGKDDKPSDSDDKPGDDADKTDAAEAPEKASADA